MPWRLAACSACVVPNTLALRATLSRAAPRNRSLRNPRCVIDEGRLSWVASIVMREVQRVTADASTSKVPAARSGGVVYVHRFGAALNAHELMHLCVLDRVFEAIPELEFDQTAKLAAEAGHDHGTHLARADAEPIPELEFDQTLGL